VTAPLLAARVTEMPPAGAGLLRVTVPVEDCPPTTVVGFRVIPLRVPAAAPATPIDSGADAEFAEVAVMVAVAGLETAVVEMRKLAVVWPAGTMTEFATVAAALLDRRLTRTPPAGAGALRVNVPVEDCPPVTDAGARVRLPMLPVPAVGTMIVNAAVVVFAEVAAMLAVAWVETAVVETVKVAVV
jgi:hypothetical protein